MAKGRYKGSLRLDWINKDLSLYYEIDEKEGRGIRPVWVPKNDIRVAEPRILRFQKSYGDAASENMLIKGDNLLVLRSLVEMFKGRPDKEKVKCIYIDIPFNSGNAFEKYDDNLQHSEWLTMMRDRLFLLRKLLNKEGSIFIHIDDNEIDYLKVLLDEIFGRQNFISRITLDARSPSAFSTVNPGVFKASEYLLWYAKEKKFFRENTLRISRPPDYAYNKWIDNPKESPEKWVFQSLADVYKDAKKPKTDKPEKMLENYHSFILQNANHIWRPTEISDTGAGRAVIEAKLKSKKSPNKIFVVKRDEYEPVYILNGQQMAFYSKNVKTVDGELAATTLLTNIWTDIAWEGIASEGDVQFKKGKKPERLIKRCLELASTEGDIVMDSFAGSGTTGAVAHKMKRRWIMVEMGKQAETHIIPRLQRAVTGEDKSGITKSVNWKGGSGFSYYKLGESIIRDQDMNWVLKAGEMAEAVFLHFQYRPVKAEWLEKENMYLGKHQSARYHFAISFASREIKPLTDEVYEKIVAELEKEKFKHLTIFTNMAVAVPPDTFDKEKVLVKKIPAAIL